jgi:hypothetical protein
MFMCKNKLFQSSGTKNKLFKVQKQKNELHARDENNNLTYKL